MRLQGDVIIFDHTCQQSRERSDQGLRPIHSCSVCS